MGVWLFYVQHQFEDVYWENSERLELRRRGAAGQLLPEAAEAAAVLHRQHRPPPRPPPQRPGPQLQPPARPRREPGLPRRPGAHRSATALQLRPAEADRHRQRPPGDLPRGASDRALRRDREHGRGRRLSPTQDPRRRCFSAANSSSVRTRSHAAREPLELGDARVGGRAGWRRAACAATRRSRASLHPRGEPLGDPLPADPVVTRSGNSRIT